MSGVSAERTPETRAFRPPPVAGLTVEDATVGTDDPLAIYLEPGHFVDADAPEVRAFAERVVGAATDETDKAVRLFYACRDGIRYDPYSISRQPDDYRASSIASASATYCIPKAVLLTAAARAVDIPARLGFADVRNHLQTPKLRERMAGKEVFLFHGYSELFIGGRWVKATPAFNRELCDRFGVSPLEFDGQEDVLLQQFTPDGGRHMEYLRDRGTFADLPFEEIMDTFASEYGEAVFTGPEDGLLFGAESGEPGTVDSDRA